MNISWPAAEEELSLHRRLRDGEASAPSDFAVAYTDLLYAWLMTKNPGVDENQCQDAAHRAVLAVIYKPHIYNPSRGELAAYLRMSAQGDLRNLVQREQRHHRGRIYLENVEEADDGGKYWEKADDPAALESDDEARRGAVLLASVREALTEPDQRCFDLLCHGEKRTPVFAAAAGFSDLRPDEQAREVKRVKDRIKKRIERAGGTP